MQQFGTTYTGCCVTLHIATSPARDARELAARTPTTSTPRRTLRPINSARDCKEYAAVDEDRSPSCPVAAGTVWLGARPVERNKPLWIRGKTWVRIPPVAFWSLVSSSICARADSVRLTCRHTPTRSSCPRPREPVWGRVEPEEDILPWWSH
ncbi:hypothetical protein B0H17DRAFT_1153476 [Mycena rosella]|uniref:Uncharacterized protein n=1 Tax=Mycena rosella TaxID=1033263 RepID=A0AAD7B5Q4_MYCRO|nr:hypothetical protein B0H17DRAFT_1153476 [Mycena rosella]